MQEKIAFLLNQEGANQQKVRLLDSLTTSIKNNHPDSKQAHQIWRVIKEDHYFWYLSPDVLQYSQVDETKVFMLVILEDAIKQKWGALPIQQRENLKSYIIKVVLQYGAIENLPKSKHNILSKANAILVQIVKYEWNTTWSSFINDICSASLKDMNICQNNFFILKMLSQQIFDYSKNQMTQQQISELKVKMNQDFTTIFQLCNFILEHMHEAKPSLLKACLETLNAFLSWIPTYYIIRTDLVDKLIAILASDSLRNFSMQCLVEIASLEVQYNNQELKTKELQMLKNTTIELNKIVPVTSKADMPKLVSGIKKGARHSFQILARSIVMFYSQFFKNQYHWLENESRGNDQLIEICKVGMNYIIMLMQIDEDQVFKISVEFFHFIIADYLEKIKNPQINNSFINKLNSVTSIFPYIFNQVMQIISLKMAKPEEVLIVIDQTGYPVRQELQNTQNSSLYQVMKELAGFLAAYDWPQMKKFILSEIQKQNGQAFSFEILNSLSWIVGSLCGSIMEKEEKQFFISTLRTLLHLCQLKKGKQNKAVIASCIMYVVGQYPTFLRNNWTFLRTVVKKLFEFMKEEFPGIMEMACNAFMKIAKTTADQFVTLQLNDSQPYIHQIIHRIPEETKKLNSDTLKLTFYQSVGYLIGAQKNSNLQLEMIKQALGSYLFQFSNIVAMLQSTPNILREEAVEHKILYFLKINESLAIGVGQQYVMMLELISETINKIYLYYSSEVNNTVITNGTNWLNYLTVKIMRAIKKQIIKIYINYLQKCINLNKEQGTYILHQFIFPLGALLKDFQECLPQTKEQEFVTLFTLVLQKLYTVISSDFLSQLLQMIFASSLPLITTDFNSFPEIRANFFSFLKALIKYNFQLLYSLDKAHFNTILECVIWSFKHQLSNYSDLGLELLQQILNNVNKSKEIANAFYPQYHIKILTQVLSVMTDGYHKSGLEMQSKIFYLLIHVITQNIAVNPISADQPPNKSNSEYLFEFLASKLSIAFPNISYQATLQKVRNWFQQLDEAKFKDQLADYLVLINRFTSQELTEGNKDAKS